MFNYQVIPISMHLIHITLAHEVHFTHRQSSLHTVEQRNRINNASPSLKSSTQTKVKNQIKHTPESFNSPLNCFQVSAFFLSEKWLPKLPFSLHLFSLPISSSLDL
ncbi:hypothetical protein AAZV13_12G096900 [Glycine max]